MKDISIAIIYSIADKTTALSILRDGGITSFSCEGGVAYEITVSEFEATKALELLKQNKHRLLKTEIIE